MESGRHIRPKIDLENRTCSQPGKQALVEIQIHFITRCDNFMQMENLRNQFFIEMLPKDYTNEKTIHNTDQNEF